MIENALQVADAAVAAKHAVTMWGTVPAWITALTTTGGLGLIVRWYTSKRASDTADRKVNFDDDMAIRAHMASELAALREQIIKSGDANAARQKAADDRYAAGIAAADQREAACQAEVAALRVEIRNLSDEIIGLRRQVAHNGRAAIVLAASSPSETILESADRAATALDELDERTHRDD